MRRTGRTRYLRALLGFALSSVLTASVAQIKSDWEVIQEEKGWVEGPVVLPPNSQEGDLVEFSVSNMTSFRFYIDAATLSVGQDGVVRFVLVARSPSGVDNVSFEGIRCKSGTYKVYAFGRADGTWSRRESSWRAIEPKRVQRWHQALRWDYFCPMNVMIGDAAEGVAALRDGGHPNRGNPSRF